MKYKRILYIMIYSLLSWVLFIPFFNLFKSDTVIAHLFFSIIYGSMFAILNEILQEIKNK